MFGLRCFVVCVLLAASSILAAAPTLSDARFVTNQFQFRLSGETGQVYIIQSSPNLTNWSSVLTNVPATNRFAFSLSATNTSQYFRAKVATPVFNHAMRAEYVDPQAPW